MDSLIEEGSTDIDALSKRKKLPRHRRERPLMQAPPRPRTKKEKSKQTTPRRAHTHNEIRCPLQLARELPD